METLWTSISEKDFREHLSSQRGYPKDFSKPNFWSPRQLFSILWVVFVGKTHFFGQKMAIFEDFEHSFWKFYSVALFSLNVYDVLKSCLKS